MGAQNVGKKVSWSVRRMDGGEKVVEGTVVAFVPAGASVRDVAPRGVGSIKKGIVDRSRADRYLVRQVPSRAAQLKEEMGLPRRAAELYVPLAGTVELALLRDNSKDMSRAELDDALGTARGRR